LPEGFPGRFNPGYLVKNNLFVRLTCHVICQSMGESSDESFRGHLNHRNWFIFRKTRQMT
jgi:hypothetical protein